MGGVGVELARPYLDTILGIALTAKQARKEGRKDPRNLFTQMLQVPAMRYEPTYRLIFKKALKDRG
jgi:hypothetical protein